MSSPTCVRVRPNRRIFATRKSRLLRRSAKNVSGAMRLTVDVAGREIAAERRATRSRSSPCSSPRGCAPATARPRAAHLDVHLGNRIRRQPLELAWCTVRRYGSTGSSRSSRSVRRTGDRVVRAGRTRAVLGQTSRARRTRPASRRPVLVPPCIVRPLRSRATTLTSTPCQFSLSSREVARPTARARPPVRPCSEPDCRDRRPCSRRRSAAAQSTGATMLNGV